jgi:hypothetical protein
MSITLCSVVLGLSSLFVANVHAEEVYVRCYGEKTKEAPNPKEEQKKDQLNPKKPETIKSILWADELSNLLAGKSETGYGIKLLDNSNAVNSTPLKQRFLVAGTWRYDATNNSIFVVQASTYDKLILLCVQTLNRGKGKKTHGFPEIERGFQLVNMTAGWLFDREYSLHRQSTSDSSSFDIFPFGMGRLKDAVKFARETKIAQDYLDKILTDLKE